MNSPQVRGSAASLDDAFMHLVGAADVAGGGSVVVGVFASLKWRLVTSRLRAAHGAARSGMIIAFVVVIAFVGFLTVGLAALRTVPDIAVPVVITVFTLQLVAWVLAPLVAFGVDETVDPTRFALLPIRPQTLQRGLLVASLIGYLPAANMILLLGAAIAIGVPWSVLPVAVVCAAVQLMICVVLSRAASTSMSALMTSRRGRDLGMAVGLRGLRAVHRVRHRDQQSGQQRERGRIGRAVERIGVDLDAAGRAGRAAAVRRRR